MTVCTSSPARRRVLSLTRHPLLHVRLSDRDGVYIAAHTAQARGWCCTYRFGLFLALRNCCAQVLEQKPCLGHTVTNSVPQRRQSLERGVLSPNVDSLTVGHTPGAVTSRRPGLNILTLSRSYLMGPLYGRRSNVVLDRFTVVAEVGAYHAKLSIDCSEPPNVTLRNLVW